MNKEVFYKFFFNSFFYLKILEKEISANSSVLRT